MSLTTVQLWQSLQDSEMASPTDCRKWAAEILASAGEEALADPQTLLAQLIKLRKVTPFQANALITNNAASLIRGPYRILFPLPHPALAEWFEAKADSSRENCWIYSLPLEHLDSSMFEKNPPSLKLAEYQPQIEAPYLQSFLAPSVVDENLTIVSSQVPGIPIREWISKSPLKLLSPAQISTVLNDVASALKVLHDAGIVHGRIGLDQILLDEQGRATLLRDPLFPAQSPLAAWTPSSLGNPKDNESRIRYAAPEFTAPNQPPTYQTDMYALGCLWWELATGKQPFSDIPLEKVMATSCKMALDFSKVNFEDSSQRICLQHLLAKNPQARFANAQTFLTAYQIAIPASKPTPIAKVPAASPASAPLTEDSVDADRVVEERSAQPTPAASKKERKNSTKQLPTPEPSLDPVSKTIPTETPAPTDGDAQRQSTDTPQPAPPPIPSSTKVKTKTSPPATAIMPAPPTSNENSTPTNERQPVSKRTQEPKDDTADSHSTTAAPKPMAATPGPSRESRAESASPPKVPHAAPLPPSRVSNEDVAPPIAPPQRIADEIPEEPPVAGNVPEKLVRRKTKSPEAQTSAEAKASKPKKGSKSKKGKKKVVKKRPVWLIPSMFGGCVVLIVGLIYFMGQSKSTRPKTDPDKVIASTPPSPTTQAESEKSTSPGPEKTSVAATTTTSKPPKPTDPFAEHFTVSKDDANFLWLPPRLSKPYSIQMLPPGMQGLIFIRTGSWTSSEVGKSLVSTLAQPIQMIWEPASATLGGSIDNVKEIAVGLYPGREDGWPNLAYRITLQKPVAIEKLKENWKNATEELAGEKNQIWVMGPSAIFTVPGPIDESQEINQFVYGPVAQISELASIDGAAGPMLRQMEQLLDLSDNESDFTMMLSPSFLFSDARSVLPGISKRTQEVVRDLINERAQGVMISTTLQPQWYGEVRIAMPDSESAANTMNLLRDKMKGAADSVESELVASPPVPYWRAIAARFPQMIRSLFKYQRFGVENTHAVTNFYLPTTAAPNMALATWMALQSPTSAPVTNVAKAPTNNAPAKTALNADTILDFPVSINFDQEPLDSALNLVTQEVNSGLPAGTPPIVLSIDGKSFELASVTRNQQIREFRFKNEPLRVLLTDLAKRVNPDKTVKSLSETKQAVVWTSEAADGKIQIIFSTRRGLEGSTKKLPKEFTESK